jgi:hypothetical protein
MGFLAPLFLAGAALIAIPWIVHQIRRPEREIARFSSLMFVPKVQKEVIQRQKIQHPWLMALRMLLLALLALAFSRPYHESPAPPSPDDAAYARHVILLDASGSMGTAGRFEEARKRALQLLDGFGANDRVAVATFDEAPRLLAALDGPGDADAGSARRARRAIAAAEPGWRTTAYLPALQRAEALLAPGDGADEAESPRRVMHLISDFQQAGMPDNAPAWRLSPLIELDAIDVGDEAPANRAVTDLVVEEIAPDQLRVRGKVKNFGDDTDRPLQVQLVVDDKVIESRELALKRGHASQVQFAMPCDPARTAALTGRLQLTDDPLPGDDRFYFAWNRRERTRVWIVGETSGTGGYSAADLMRLVVPDAPGAPWTTTVLPVLSPGDLTNAATAPRILVLTEVSGLDAGSARALIDFCRRGGQALVLLGPGVDAARLNADLLGAVGVTCEGPRYPTLRETTFDTFEWVDLGHPVFVPFRDARYNDFSALRFYNHQVLRTPAGDDSTRVLARFGDDSPAMIEMALGDGRLLLWTFSLDFEQTNLPKKATFVPLLLETLGYLTPRAARAAARYRVGDRALPPPVGAGDPPWRVSMPGDEDWLELNGSAPPPAPAAPGLLRWRNPAEPGWEYIDAVNIDPRESDPARVPVAEFQIRLCSTPPAPPANPAADSRDGAAAEAATVRREYGYPLIGILLLLVLFESVYTMRLAARAADGKAATP